MDKNIVWLVIVLVICFFAIAYLDGSINADIYGDDYLMVQ